MDKGYQRFYEITFKDFLLREPKGYYNEAALPSYTHKNRLMAWLFWKRIDIALLFAGNVENKKVLDFGCGGGIIFKYLSSHGARIFACEKQFYSLAETISDKLGAGVKIFKDISEIDDIKFDIIFALDVLEHVDNVEGVIEKMVHLSHDKTRLIISGPTENFIYRVGRIFAGFSGHYHKRSIYEIEMALISKGLEMDRLKKLFPILTLFRISSWSHKL